VRCGYIACYPGNYVIRFKSTIFCVGLLGAFCVGLFAAGAARQARSTETYVRAGADLQAALDAARPGDTILLEPGATFVGNFTLPAHGGTRPITVRSAAAAARLPDEGTRITPEHASQLPKIRSPNTGPALATDPGAAYWRLMFLEFQATRRGYYDILRLGDGSEAQRSLALVPHDLVVDRVYIHGDPLHGQKRGIALNSASTTIANSYISDIKAIGQDSQAIGGWNGPGPYVIENNYLEAAGEVFMLGGSDPAIPNLVPTDIVLRGNVLTRPLRWRDAIVPAPDKVRSSVATGGTLTPGTYTYQVVASRPAFDTDAFSPPSAPVSVQANAGARITIAWQPVADAAEYRVYVSAAGKPLRYWTVTSPTITDDGLRPAAAGSLPGPTLWQVKNLLELKNARRVRIVENVLENNWAQAQSGVAVMFTPRNQDGRCPWCIVEDVTFERNVVRSIGAGITIQGRDDEKTSQQANTFRILHNEFSDLSKRWGGSAYFLYLMGDPRSVVVDHNTIVSPDGSGIINVDGPPIRDFVFTNNIARHNNYGIIGNDHGPGLNSIEHFFPEATITRNVLADISEYKYPPGNLLVTASQFESHFADYAKGDFRLKPGTDWAGAGTDHMDLGAGLDVRSVRLQPDP
jgi:hypothetical protein